MFRNTMLAATVALSIASLCVTATVSQAQEARKTLKAGIVFNFPPLEYKDVKTGELTGFNYDLMNAMAKKAGLTVTWVEGAWADQASFVPLRTGRVDVATGDMWDTPARREAGISFVNFLYEPTYFFTVADRAKEIQDPIGLCGKKVANTRGSKAMFDAVERWSQETCVKAGKEPIQQIEVGMTADQILMLKQRRVDAGFSGAATLVQSKKVDGDAHLVAISGPVDKFLYGYPVLKENLAVRDMLKKSLDEVISEGTYAELLKKWGLPEDSSIGKEALIDAGK